MLFSAQLYNVIESQLRIQGIQGIMNDTILIVIKIKCAQSNKILRRKAGNTLEEVVEVIIQI